MTDAPPLQVVSAALVLPEGQRLRLLQVLQDVPDLQVSLQYIGRAPQPLCPHALRAHLAVHYAERWQLPLGDVAGLLDAVEGRPAQADRPTPASEDAPPEAAAPVVQRLGALLSGGWTPPRIAEALTASGVTAGRGAIRQLSRGRHLRKATDALLNALMTLPDAPPGNSRDAGRLQAYRQAMQDLNWVGIADLQQFLERLPAEASRPVQELIHELGAPALNDALHPRRAGQDNLAAGAAFEALTTYLQGLVSAQQLHGEINRTRNLGWSLPALTTLLRQQGYAGSALQAGKNTMSADQIAEVTQLLRRHVQAPPPSGDAAAPSVGEALTRTPDRIAFVTRILDEKGVVCTTDITQPFGMRGGAAMTFLRQTMKLQACGQGQYRRPR